MPAFSILNPSQSSSPVWQLAHFGISSPLSSDQVNNPADPSDPPALDPSPIESTLTGSISSIPPLFTSPIPLASAFSSITITLLPSAASIVDASQTPTSGGSAITISNIPISAAGPDIIIMGTATLTLPGPIGADLGDPSALTIGSERYTKFADTAGAASSGDIAVAVDGNTATVAGVRISLGSSDLVVGSRTEQFRVTTQVGPDTHFIVAVGTERYKIMTPVATVGSVPSTLVAVAIDGVTITEGGPEVTVSGVGISLKSGEKVVESQIETFSGPTRGPSGAPFVITVGTERYTIVTPEAAIASASSGPVAIAADGTTVFEAAAAVTIGGTKVSLGNSDLVIGTQTFEEVSASTVGALGIGGLIWSAMGGVEGTPVSVAPTATGVVDFEGVSQKRAVVRFWWAVVSVGSDYCNYAGFGLAGDCATASER